MADAPSPHLRGVEAPTNKDGTRKDAKFHVVYQPDVSDDPLPYGWFYTQDDARDYVRYMRAQGHTGLRVVSAKGNGE